MRLDPRQGSVEPAGGGETGIEFLQQRPVHRSTLVAVRPPAPVCVRDASERKFFYSPTLQGLVRAPRQGLLVVCRGERRDQGRPGVSEECGGPEGDAQVMVAEGDSQKRWLR